MDASNQLSRLVSAPQTLSIEALRQLNKDYSYMPLPAIALLKYHHASLPESEVNSLRLHLAMISGDKTALFNLLGDHAEAFAGLYPKSESSEHISTDNAIDTFFANYGMADPGETALLERMIFNPVPDYSEILLAESGDTTDSLGIPDMPPVPPRHPQSESVNPAPAQPGAPASAPAPKAAPAPQKASAPAKTPEPADDTLLSESLAKIFIKQGRYERAYEIISNLSLNYPKKSIYFADQLRFLQKLIKIKQAANGK